MSNNLLVHVMVPALGLRSKQWTVISWARSQTARESLLDAKYVYRLAVNLWLLLNSFVTNLAWSCSNICLSTDRTVWEGF